MSATSGKPLSDVMERALIALVDLARSDRSDGVERRWHHFPAVVDRALGVVGIGESTIVALDARGLVETDYSNYPRYRLARATDAGIELCDGMGD